MTSPSGIAWDGQRLFMTDVATGSLYRLDTHHGTTRGSAALVGRLIVPLPLPGRVVNNPAGLAWVNSTNTLYMGGDNPDAIYTVDRRNFSFTRFKNMGTITDISGIEWVGTTMYAVDDGADALYTIPGVPSSAPTRTLDGSYLPSEGDLYYNGGNFADAFMKWDNPSWTIDPKCPNHSTDCPTYEHDLSISKSWFSPIPFRGFGLRDYCTTWTDLPNSYDDCPTEIAGHDSGDSANHVLSFGSFQAQNIVAGRNYYGHWLFHHQRGGVGSQAAVSLHGQEGEYDSRLRNKAGCPWVQETIWCIFGVKQAKLSGTTWVRGTSNYIGYRRLV